MEMVPNEIKDEVNIDFRKIRGSDSAQFETLLQKLYVETQFMLYEPGEHGISIREAIDKISHQKNSAIFVAEFSSQLIGYLFVSGGRAKRDQHVASLSIGVLQHYCNKGCGKKLFDQAEQWMLSRNIARVELAVATRNLHAVNFYLKRGFQLEGMKRKAFQIDNFYDDMYMMGKLFL